jgi:RNA polymerase sigma-70 factor (sigma-E family)
MDVAHHRRGVLKEPATASFVEFYRHEWRDVVGLGFVLTGDRCVAEDLAQEGFAAAYRRWDCVGAMDKPGAWVRRVVANQSVSWFRRRGAERRALARVGNPRESSDIELDSQVAELWAAVRKLPRRQRQAIALVYFSGMSEKDASHVMGCGQETVRTHLKRGRQALATKLGIQEDSDA